MPVPGNSVQSDQAGFQRRIQLFRLWKVDLLESKNLGWWFLWFLLSSNGSTNGLLHMERKETSSLSSKLNTDCDNPSSTFSCHLKCPAPASFSYSPAPIYTCKYSEGVFRPAQVLRMGILKWAKDNHCPTMVMVMVILIGTMRKSNCCKKKKKKKKIVVLTLQKVSPRQRE